jgi:hypothetical protein
MMSKFAKGWSLLCLLLGACFLMAPGCQKQVTYVIGGFGWKANYLDLDGYVATDGVDNVNTQYNLANGFIGTESKFVAYESGQKDPKLFDCGGCHTTGYAPDDSTPEGYAGSGACITCHSQIFNSFAESGHQHILNAVNGAAPDYPAFCPGVEAPEKFTFGTTPGQTKIFDLPGIQGQWVEANVGCEACHGPSKDHAGNPAGVKPSITAAREACRTCHISGRMNDGIEQADNIISTNGDLINYRQEWEEWQASPHNTADGPDCATCHNPHATTIYGDRAQTDGRRVYENGDCLTCHPGVSISQNMASLLCIDCHMPYAGKLAVSKNIIGKEGNYMYVGDVRSHQFRINAVAASPNAFFTADRTAVQLDASGKVMGLTVNFVCQPCHSPGGIRPHGLPAATPYTFDELKQKAPLVHAAP